MRLTFAQILERCFKHANTVTSEWLDSRRCREEGLDHIFLHTLSRTMRAENIKNRTSHRLFVSFEGAPSRPGHYAGREVFDILVSIRSQTCKNDKLFAFQSKRYMQTWPTLSSVPPMWQHLPSGIQEGLYRTSGNVTLINSINNTYGRIELPVYDVQTRKPRTQSSCILEINPSLEIFYLFYSPSTVIDQAGQPIHAGARVLSANDCIYKLLPAAAKHRSGNGTGQLPAVLPTVDDLLALKADSVETFISNQVMTCIAGNATREPLPKLVEHFRPRAFVNISEEVSESE